jgi:hypothetical protein
MFGKLRDTVYGTLVEETGYFGIRLFEIESINIFKVYF